MIGLMMPISISVMIPPITDRYRLNSSSADVSFTNWTDRSNRAPQSIMICRTSVAVSFFMSASHHLRHLGCRRGVAAALGADDAVDDGHADAGDVAHADALQQVLAGGVLGPVHDDEIGGAARFDQAAIELALSRGVAGGKAERDLRGYISERTQHGDHAQDAQGLHAGARRRIRAEDDAVELLDFVGGAQRIEGRGLVAVMHDLDGAAALLAEAAD